MEDDPSLRGQVERCQVQSFKLPGAEEISLSDHQGHIAENKDVLGIWRSRGSSAPIIYRTEVLEMIPKQKVVWKTTVSTGWIPE